VKLQEVYTQILTKQSDRTSPNSVILTATHPPGRHDRILPVLPNQRALKWRNSSDIWVLQSRINIPNQIGLVHIVSPDHRIPGDPYINPPFFTNSRASNQTLFFDTLPEIPSQASDYCKHGFYLFSYYY
jgi:hypothetical protein